LVAFVEVVGGVGGRRHNNQPLIRALKMGGWWIAKQSAGNKKGKYDANEEDERGGG